MIKLLEARYVGHHRIELTFSDGRRGVFDVDAYLTTRQGKGRRLCWKSWIYENSLPKGKGPPHSSANTASSVAASSTRSATLPTASAPPSASPPPRRQRPEAAD